MGINITWKNPHEAPIALLKAHVEILKNQKYNIRLKSESLQYLRNKHDFETQSAHAIEDAISILEREGF